MGKIVILATMVAILLVFLATGVVAQTPDDWQPGVGPAEGLHQAAPETPVQPEAAAPQEGLQGLQGEGGRDGLNGQDGQPGRDGQNGRNGRNGKNGRNGRDGKTIIREGHQGHGSVLNMLSGTAPGHWNVVSGSYVEAKIAAAIRDLIAAGTTGKSPAPPATPPTKSSNWSWLWWLLLIPLFMLLCHIITNWRRIWNWLICWLRSVLYPQPPTQEEKPKPDMTNTVCGTHYGCETPEAKIAGTRQKKTFLIIRKGVCNLRTGSDWIWAEPGQEIEFKYFPGDLVEFCVQIENPGLVDVPTEGLTLTDKLTNLPVKPGTGKVQIEKGRLFPIQNDQLVKDLASGSPIEVGQFADKLPKKACLNLRFQVDTTGHQATGHVGSPGTTEEQPQEPVQPLVKLDDYRQEAAEAEKAEAKAKAKAAAKVAAAQPAVKATPAPAEQAAPGSTEAAVVQQPAPAKKAAPGGKTKTGKEHLSARKHDEEL